MYNKKLDLIPEFDHGCVFCGEEAKESFHSGSYDTYLEPCKCEKSTRYQNLLKELEDLMKPYKTNKQLEEIEQKIKTSESIIRNLMIQKSYLQDKNDRL